MLKSRYQPVSVTELTLTASCTVLQTDTFVPELMDFNRDVVFTVSVLLLVYITPLSISLMPEYRTAIRFLDE